LRPVVGIEINYGLAIERTSVQKEGKMNNKAEEMVPLLPPRKVLFRERGETLWKQHHFTILGQIELLELNRSLKPMHLMLTTDIDGFRSTEVIGLDLFAAIASAILTAESLIIMLQRTGEIQLRENSDFDMASDSVFFGSRVQKLRETFEHHASKKKEFDSGDAPLMPE
jgi:hypothetical protein